MNTPATFASSIQLDPSTQTPSIVQADSSTPADDLVLRFVGGKNNGEFVSVSTNCCTLGITRHTADNKSVQDRCAIYRGPAGVTIQSHGEEVLINGEAKSVHWLKQGDRIQVSKSQSLEVVQLGSCQSVSEASEVSAQDTIERAARVAPTGLGAAPAGQVAPAVDAPAAEARTVSLESGNEPEAVMESVEVAGDRIDFVGSAVTQGFINDQSSFSELPVVAPAADAPVAEPTPDAWGESTVEATAADEEFASTEEATSASVGETGQLSEQASQRFESLENSIGQLHDQAANVDRRFNRLEDSLNALTEHLERLAVGSLSSDSVESTPDESSALVAQYGQEVPAAEAPAVATPPTPETLAVPQEATEVADSSAVTSAGDNHEKSIAALFSELATTAEPTSNATTSANEVSAADAFATPVAQAPAQVASEVAPASVADDLAAIQMPSEVPAAEVENPEAFAPTAPSGSVEAPTEQPAAAFTEQMMAPLHDRAPTLTSEEIAGLVGTVDETATPSETESSAVHAEARTESVADIFARLHAGDSATEGAAEEPSPEAPIPQTVQTTFEDIQASISAAFDTDVPSGMTGSVDNADSNQVVAAEPVDVVETAEVIETIEPSTPEDDINSVMAKLRASLEAEEEGTADTEQSTEATETADAPAGVRQKQDSVEDYMSMLMDRMNGDSTGSATDERPESDNVQATEDGLLDNKVVETLLTEEEFKPSKRAAPIKSLDKMRELANSSSRSAVQRSEKAQQSEQRKSLILQSLAFGSFLLAATMIWAKSYIFGGAFFFIFFVTSAYFVYDSMNPTGTPVASVKSQKKNASSGPNPDSDDN